MKNILVISILSKELKVSGTTTNLKVHGEEQVRRKFTSKELSFVCIGLLWFGLLFLYDSASFLFNHYSYNGLKPTGSSIFVVWAVASGIVGLALIFAGILTGLESHTLRRKDKKTKD